MYISGRIHHRNRRCYTNYKVSSHFLILGCYAAQPIALNTGYSIYINFQLGRRYHLKGFFFGCNEYL